MRRKLWYVGLVIVALGLFGVFVVLPAIDREMMKTPVVNALAAVKSRDFRSLRGCFTKDAKFNYHGFKVPMDLVIRGVQPFMTHDHETPSVRFGGYSNIQRSGKKASADVEIIYYYEGDDSPYRKVPVIVKGHVELEKQGWFDWKITQAGTENEDVGALILPRGE